MSSLHYWACRTRVSETDSGGGVGSIYSSLIFDGVFEIVPAACAGPETPGPRLALTSREGHPYFGLPVIPVVFQQSVNAVLTASDGTQQRANYGTAFAPSSWAWPRVESD